VRVPRVAERLEAAPAVARRERHAEEVAELAIEVGHAALGMFEDADYDVAERGEPLRDQAEGGGLAGARISGEEREAAFAHQVLEAPAEVLEPRRDDQGLRRDLGREGVPRG
jgi:hypothetical protein